MKNKFTYQLGLYEKSMPNSLSLDEKLNEAKAAGFEYLELSVDETDDKLARLEWSGHERREAVDMILESGIRILSICLSGNRRYPIGSEDSGKRGYGVNMIKQAVRLASDLGVRLIQIAGYDEYYGDSNAVTRRNFLQNIGLVTCYAAKFGVILAFETMETEFMNTVKKALEVVNRVNSPYLQIYPDTGNIFNAAAFYGTDPVMDLMSGRGHIAAMHLKESLPGVYREVPYGTGHVDFPEAVEAAASMGVSLFVGEFWFSGNDDWRSTLSETNSFLRKKIEQAGGVSYE